MNEMKNEDMVWSLLKDGIAIGKLFFDHKDLHKIYCSFEPTPEFENCLPYFLAHEHHTNFNNDGILMICIGIYGRNWRTYESGVELAGVTEVAKEQIAGLSATEVLVIEIKTFESNANFWSYEPKVWALKKHEVTIGILYHAGTDQPWIICDFEPAAGWDEFLLLYSSVRHDWPLSEHPTIFLGIEPGRWILDPVTEGMELIPITEKAKRWIVGMRLININTTTNEARFRPIFRFQVEAAQKERSS